MVNWKLKTFWFWSLDEHLFAICKTENASASRILKLGGELEKKKYPVTPCIVVRKIGYYYVSIFHSEIKLKASWESYFPEKYLYFLFSVFCLKKSLKLDPTRPTGLFTACRRWIVAFVWLCNWLNSRDSPDLKSQTTTE